MKSLSLYTLVGQFRALESLELDWETDETALEAIRNTLDGLEGEIQVKAQNIGAFILNTEAYATAAKEAGNRLLERSKRIMQRIGHVREYVRMQMEFAGMKKIDGPELTLSRKSNPPAVVIAPDAEIPAAYLQPPDPIIAGIVAGAIALSAGRQSLDRPEEDRFILVTPAELEKLIAQRLPPRAPDKKLIAERLKIERDANAALLQVAPAGKDAVLPKSALPGCSLQQGERLEIKA